MNNQAFHIKYFLFGTAPNVGVDIYNIKWVVPVVEEFMSYVFIVLVMDSPLSTCQAQCYTLTLKTLQGNKTEVTKHRRIKVAGAEVSIMKP